MKKFLIIIEKSKDGYNGNFLDLLGCVAVGRTREET